MGIIHDTGSGAVLKDWGPSQIAIVQSATQVPVSSGGSVSSSTVNLRNISTATAAGVTTNYRISTTFSGSAASQITLSNPPLWSISNGSGSATVDQAGNVTFVSAGTVNSICTTKNPSSQSALTLTLTSTITTSTTFTSWQQTDLTKTTLGYEMNNEVDSKIATAGSSPGTKLNLFSTWSSSPAGTFVRNASVWTGSLDWTGVPIQPASGYWTFCGAMITPQDGIISQHVAPHVGSTIYCADSSGSVQSSTVASVYFVANCDVAVFHLQNAFTSAIKFYKLLPPNYYTFVKDYNTGTYPNGNWSFNYFPLVAIRNANNTGGVGPQALVLDSNFPSQVAATAFGATGVYNQANADTSGLCVCPETNRAPYTFSVIPGDSGSAYFVIANTGSGAEPILCGSFHYAGGGGAWMPNEITAINSALVTLGSSYTVTTASLSNYSGPY